MLRNHLKLALRMLRRRRVYALVNGTGLTVGLLCVALVALFLRHELQYDRFHDNPDDVHRVLREKRTNWWSTIPFPRYEEASTAEQRRLPQALTEQVPTIDAATNFYVGPHGEETSAYVERGDRRFTENHLLYTTTGAAFFEVFSFDVLRGDPSDLLQGPGSAVLTESASRQYFRQVDGVVGKLLTVHAPRGVQEVEVTGIIEDVPPTSHFTFEVALQVDRIPNWGAYVYVRTLPDASTEGLTSRVRSIMNEVRPQRVEDPLLRSVLGGVRIQALPDIHLGPRMLYDQQSHRDPRYLWAFGAIGLLILLIVGINYTNLAVALSSERRREIGIRKVSGAGRGQVAGQFLIEAVVLTFLCLPVVLIGLEGVVPVFNQVMNSHLQNDVLTSPLLLSGLVGLALFVGLCAGSYPALVLSRKEAVSLFQESLGSGTKRTGPMRTWSMRHALIAVQFALLIGLGGVTWFVNSQLHFLQTKDLGFETQGLVELPQVDSTETYRQIRNQLRSAPEIQAVIAGIAPGPGRFHVTYRAEDSERVRSNGDILTVDPGWFQVLGSDLPAVRQLSATES